MDISSNIKLSLSNEELGSKLKETVYEEELKQINNKYPLDQDEVDIRQTYIIKNVDSLEVGFFVRNGSRSKISLEYMPLVIENNVGKVVAHNNFNFKDYGVIPALSAMPYTGIFMVNSFYNFKASEEYILRFANINNASVFSSTTCDLEDIPDEITFEEEKEIKDYINKLEPTKSGEVSLSVYKVHYDKDGNISCTILIRNGSDSEATVKNLPITILDEEGKIIAKKSFYSEKEIVKVNAKKAKFLELKINANTCEIDKEKASKLSALFKY